MRYYKKAIAAIMAVAVLVGLEPYIERTNIHSVQCASAQTLEDTMETSAQLSESATGIPTQTPDVTQGVSACDYYQNMSTIGKDTSVVTISNADDLRAYIKIMQKVTGFGLTFVQTADIALSDYNFRYDESLKRIAVYDEDTLKCTVASDGTAYQPDNSDRRASYAALGMSEDFLWLHGHDFHGVYQGNHHRISGALLGGSSIFGNARGAVVNLVLEGCAEIAATDCALFAKELQGAIVNCCARNCIIVDVERGYAAWDVGAFASRVTEKAVVEQCTSENNQVIAEDICGDNISLNVGGIAGSSYGSIRDCRVQGGVVHGSNAGGVSGLISAGEVMGCYNSADVYGMCYTGGICGWNAAMTYLQMSECVNEGTVHERSKTSGSMEQYAGGIIGYTLNGITINRCRNAGNISSGEQSCNAASVSVGGILGGGWNDGSCDWIISNTVNTGTLIERQHSISYIGGVVGDGAYPLLRLSNIANFGTLLYTVQDTYAEAAIGGILGRGCEAEQTGSTIWNLLQQHAMTNCVNYGTVQFDSDSKSEEQIDYHAVTGGGLSGNAAATAWKNCYEASVSDLPLFGKEGNGTIMEVHRIDRAQRAGEASAAFISENAASYAHTSSLAEALNAYVSAQNGAKGDYLSWLQGDDTYPTLNLTIDLTRSGYSTDRLVDGASLLPKPSAAPTSSPTKTPTANPSVTTSVAPNIRPTANPSVTPSVAPNIRPTANPSVTPSVAPNIRPTAVPTKRPTVVPTKRPAAPTKHPWKHTIAPKKYPAPRVKVVRKKTKAGQRYIQVSLRKKQNCYLQFYRKTKLGFMRLKLKKNRLKNGHRKINIAYSRKMKTVTYKIRIYKKVNGRRKYSKFTKVKKMRLS